MNQTPKKHGLVDFEEMLHFMQKSISTGINNSSLEESEKDELYHLIWTEVEKEDDEFKVLVYDESIGLIIEPKD